ncbi:lysogenization regulator HflD [Enterovibrio norvegicus FF-33]|uniref:High frequency lysogenization protein HflD homolog n=1 Tax=Enterovibrio norvegicus FF-454 TaxID=1185651 RepID=A0A1E5C2P3_9GAMM|nr:high frequency lysogenization protein HflD [Enterovibrio norvegicus]OEE59756.1 lysogenization regulator HflD [Enterovibrio norvegicus FF-454]OEE70160.1 lysogenization regulator HflD [Enterovibrio norvegicus FF-33]
MANTLFDRTIAFASICQSVKLVQEISRTGSCDPDALSASLKSIIVTNPASTLEVFGNEENLTVGLNTLISELDNSPGGSELTRYLINLLALERKLSGRRDSLAQLSDRLENVQRQVQHFDLLDDQMISNLASVYLDTISPLGPRIQVTGNPAQLQQTGVQHKVRALLLSGIRSAVLWRQVGGKRRHLIFGRKQMIEQAKIILARNS